jgi:hypothetical protein
MAHHLSYPVREAIEGMLGRALQDDEQVSVLAVRPLAAPTGDERLASARRLEAAMDAIAAKALPVDPMALDEAVEEAMAAVRPRRR